MILFGLQLHRFLSFTERIESDCPERGCEERRSLLFKNGGIKEIKTIIITPVRMAYLSSTAPVSWGDVLDGNVYAHSHKRQRKDEILRKIVFFIEESRSQKRNKNNETPMRKVFR